MSQMCVLPVGTSNFQVARLRLPTLPMHLVSLVAGIGPRGWRRLAGTCWVDGSEGNQIEEVYRHHACEYSAC